MGGFYSKGLIYVSNLGLSYVIELCNLITLLTSGISEFHCNFLVSYLRTFNWMCRF